MSMQNVGTDLQKLVRSKKTPIGLYRFATRLQLLLPHLQAAGEGFRETDLEVPAEKFFRSRTSGGKKARDILFHLEALTRIYKKTHDDDEDVFVELNGAFKELEDGLGRIDYFDEFKAVTGKMEGVPPKVVGYFVGGYHVELQNLTKRLRDSGWLVAEKDGLGAPKLKRILKLLQNVDWKKQRKDREAVLDFFVETLDKVIDKSGRGTSGKGLDFDNLEHGVHEFRRTVRWMNIYPQALGGLCRLVNDGADELDPTLSEYQTSKILGSSFNDYPSDDMEEHPLKVDASLMYAFSAVIDAIGGIKDDGQLAEALELALIRTGEADHANVHARVQAMTVGRVPLSDIPTQVMEIVDRFMDVNRVPWRLSEWFTKQRK